MDFDTARQLLVEYDDKETRRRIQRRMSLAERRAYRERIAEAEDVYHLGKFTHEEDLSTIKSLRSCLWCMALSGSACVGVAVYSVMPVLWLVLSCAAIAFACLVGMLFLITWLSTMADVSILPRWLLYVASFSAPLLFWIVINLFS